jgi:hypothetical protein
MHLLKSTLFFFTLWAITSSTAFAQPSCLDGTYTIGGTAPDFSTLAEAVSELESEGVCGPVVFEVRAGTYNEQISISEISGASVSNTITFESESGNNSDVILQFESSSTFSDPNYTLQLNGADYVRIENMTIERTGTNLYARVVDFSGDASDNVIEGCIISGRATGSTSNDNSAVVFSDEDNAGIANNAFNNNEILFGFAGIVWESNSSNPKSRLTVTNNTFRNYRYGLLIDYATDLTITGNSISNNPANFNNAQLKGVECFRCEEELNISGNTIVMTDGTSNYGIDLQASVGSINAVGVVSNNMVIVGGTGTSHAINSGSLTSYKNYYHNSCYTTGTNATSSSAFYMNGSNNINIINNALFGATGNAIEVLTTSGVLTSDYNLLYSNGPYVGKWSSDQATLADYQIASGGDFNSVSADPEFTSGTDLHISATSPAIAAGTSGLGISEDIDGETRDLSNPDIGADEASSVVIGIADVKDEFKIYTNHDDQIVLESLSGRATNGTIFIRDMAGRLVLSDDVAVRNGSSRVQVSALTRGFYVVSLVSRNEQLITSTKLFLGQ